MSDLFKVEHHKLFSVTWVGMEAVAERAGEFCRFTYSIVWQILTESLTFSLFFMLGQLLLHCFVSDPPPLHQDKCKSFQARVRVREGGLYSTPFRQWMTLFVMGPLSNIYLGK